MHKPKVRQDWILQELEKQPNLSFSDCFTEYNVKFAKSRITFTKDWTTAKPKHDNLQLAKQQAIEAAAIKGAVAAAKKGIKTKNENLLALQQRAEAILADITSGTTTQTVMVEGKAVSFDRPLAPSEVAALNSAYIATMTVISRLQGHFLTKATDNAVNFMKTPQEG